MWREIWWKVKTAVAPDSDAEEDDDGMEEAFVCTGTPDLREYKEVYVTELTWDAVGQSI